MTKKNKSALAVCLLVGMVGLIAFDLMIAPRTPVEEPRENLSQRESFVPLPPPEPPAQAEVPLRVADTTTSPPPPAQPPAIPQVRKHKVQTGDSLWKIAAKYDTLKPKQMMDKIIKANRDKLQSTDTPLKLGWELVIPQ
jgi:LysM repeat protein